MENTETSSQAPTNMRTPGELVIRTVATHIFTVGNYAYMSTLQQRSTRTGLHALRVVLFAFVPTLIIVEVLNSSIRSVIRFIRDQIDENEEEEGKNVWFHLSAAVGMHASMPNPSQTTKIEMQKVPLLKLDPTLTNHGRVTWSWKWAGKLFATLFALTQAIGAVVIYARRVNRDECLSFDHRNGAMGIASTICSAFSIIVLLLRIDWSVARSLQPSAAENYLASRTTLMSHTLMAITLHLTIASLFSYTNRWMYSSAGVIMMLGESVGVHDGNPFTWECLRSASIALSIYVFRKEIATKVGVDQGRYQRWISHRSWLRIKALLGIALFIWCLVDVGVLLVKDIVNVVQARSDDDYWWQDPISDKIFVI